MAWFGGPPASWAFSLSSPVVSNSLYPGLPFILSMLLLEYSILFLALGAVAKVTAFLSAMDTESFGAPSTVVFYLLIWLNLPFSETGKVKALVCSEGISSCQFLSYEHNALG